MAFGPGSGLGSTNGLIVETPPGPWTRIGRPISVASSLTASSSALAALALSALCSSASIWSWAARSSAVSSAPGVPVLSTGTSSVPNLVGSGAGLGSMNAVTRWPFARSCTCRKRAICVVVDAEADDARLMVFCRRLSGEVAAGSPIACCTALNRPSGLGAGASGRMPSPSVPNVRVMSLLLSDNAMSSIAAILCCLVCESIGGSSASLAAAAALFCAAVSFGALPFLAG